MNRIDKLAMFYKEINDIADDNLRKLATEVIACADDYFFTIPASSSGKFHPPFSLGEGGLVRHTKCVVYMVNCLCESFNIDEYKKDMLIVAALAHDIKKQGDCAEGLGYTVHEITNYIWDALCKETGNYQACTDYVEPEMVNKQEFIDKACEIYRKHLIKFNPALEDFSTALDEAVNVFRKQLES